MGIKNVYDVAARAMSAQIVRMNAIASNLANANNVSGSKEDVYKPLRPVFKTIYSDQLKQTGLSTVDAIRVESLDREPIKTYQPNHPAADEEGYLSYPAIALGCGFAEAAAVNCVSIFQFSMAKGKLTVDSA